MSKYRLYGDPPYRILLLHGGPGAAGSLAPLASELSSEFSIIEHLQTKHTLHEQIQGLKHTIKNKAQMPVILIGHSWGAWLGFLFSGYYPSFIKKLILVSSGPFEEKYTNGLLKTRAQRLDEAENNRLKWLLDYLNDPSIKEKNTYFKELEELMDKADSYQAIPNKNDYLNCDYDLYQKIWEEAARLRSNNTLLRFGHQIKCPVVSIHGDYDPHPYQGVKQPLSQTLKNFRFILLENCGHKPWEEEYARDKFFKTLKNELKE